MSASTGTTTPKSSPPVRHAVIADGAIPDSMLALNASVTRIAGQAASMPEKPLAKFLVPDESLHASHKIVHGR